MHAVEGGILYVLGTYEMPLSSKSACTRNVSHGLVFTAFAEGACAAECTCLVVDVAACSLADLWMHVRGQ